MAAVEYPEHAKLERVKDASQAIGEFLDLGPWRLCEWREAGDNGQPRYVWEEGVETCALKGVPVEGRTPGVYDALNGDAKENPEFDEWPEGYYPVRGTIPQILARYFEIDLDAIEAEKRQMLASLASNTGGGG